MNMISTAFPIDTGVSGKKDALVSKLVSAWEKKNLKAARAGGVSLMALTLAACGAEDETPFAQADVDAAVAAATVVATATATAAAESVAADNAAAAAVVAAATQATAVADAEAAALFVAAATDTTPFAQADVDAAAAAATLVAEATATAAAAVASTAALDAQAVAVAAATATAEAAAATAAAALKVTTDATLASLQATYDALVAPIAATLTTAVTDVINGRTGNDTITATNLTYNAGDLITDASSTDADVLTISVDGADLAAAATVAGIETITVNVTSVLAGTTPLEFLMDMLNITGMTTLNVNATNASTLVNNVQIDNAKTMTLTTDSEYLTVNIDAIDNASFVVNGAGTTITADAAVGNVTNLTATVTATAAGTIVTDADGTVVVTTTGDTSVTANDAANVTVTSSGNATVGASDILANAVTVTSTEEAIVTANAAETVTISAGDGIDAASATAIDSSLASSNLSSISVNLSGNGAATSLDVTAATTVNNIAISGDQDVTVKMSMATVDGLGASTSATADDNIVTISDASTAGTSTLSFTASGGDVDTSAAAVDVVDIAAALAGTETLTVASGTAMTVSGGTDLANLLNVSAKAPTATDNSVSITISDDAAAGASGDFGAVTLNNFKTATITAGDTSTASDIDAITATGTDLTLALGSRGFATPAATNIGSGALTVTGSAAIDFGTNDVTAASINASAMTGNFTMDLKGTGTVGTVTTGGGADNIQMTTGARSAGDYVIVTGAGNDDIGTAVVEGFTLDAGLGTDTLTFTGALDLSAQTVSLAGVENILNAGAVTLSAAAFASDNIFSKAGAGLLTISGTANADNINASNTVVTAGALTISGGLSGDTLTGAATATTINGGGGNDTITGGAAADVLNGDNGNDTIVTGNGGDTATGGAGNDTITGGTGADTMTGGAGADTLTGGTGADTYRVNTGEVVSGDSIVEAVTADVDVVAVVTTTDMTPFTAASFDNIGSMTFAANQNGTVSSTQMTGETIALTGTGGGTETLTINMGIGETGVFSGITATNAIVSIVGATGAETITASAAGGAILGGTGADTITGVGGADVITGGVGIDSITLGGGNNVVAIGAAELTNANRDTVTDFTVANDGVRIDATFTSGDITDGAAGAEYQTDTAAGAVLIGAGEVIVELSWEFDADVSLATATKAQFLSAVGAADDGTAASVTANTFTVNADADAQLAIAYQGGAAYFFKINDGANAGSDNAQTILAAEATDLFELVGIYENITLGAFTNADFIA
jgi:Ca2+-binding RTX toxin-like protein